MAKNSNQPINVLLVDDSASVRNVLKNILNSKENIKVTAEAGDARYALQLIDEGFKGIVVIDLNLPDSSGIEAIQKMKQNKPELAVVVISFNSDIRYIQESFKAGAIGYVLKERANEDLHEAILKATNRTGFISVDITP